MNQNSAATFVRRAHAGENFTVAAARDANHLPPIRSFFDRIRSARAVCAVNCKKILACADVNSACALDAKINARSGIIFGAPGRRRNTIVVKSPYFIGCFALPAKNIQQYATCSPSPSSHCMRALLTMARRAKRARRHACSSEVTVFFVLLV
jgi:hypothetical protein